MRRTCFSFLFLAVLACESVAFQIGRASYSSRSKLLSMHLPAGTSFAPEHPRFNLKQSFRALTAGLLLSTSLGNPMNSFAFEASELFSKSDEAIQTTKSSYKLAESEWGLAKRQLEDDFKATSKSGASIAAIREDLLKLEQQLAKIEASGEIGLPKVQAEIDAIIQIVNSKYEAAAAAASAPNAKPATIAKLFDTAQNDAYILDQTVTLQKNFKEAAAAAKTLHSKLQQSLGEVNELTSQELTTITKEQQQALAALNEGVDVNLKSCRDAVDQCASTGSTGIVSFKKGIQTLTAAQEKFGKVLRSLDSTIRNTQSVKSDYERVLSKLQSQQQSRSKWEKERSLSLKQSKQLVNQFTSDVNSAVRNLDDKYKRFASEYELLSGKKSSSDRSKSEKTLSQLLRNAQEKLEASQRTGVAADKLLVRARQQGEKEAAKFLKNVPKSSTATAVDATTAPVAAPTAVSASANLASYSDNQQKPAPVKPYASLAQNFKKDRVVMMSSP